MTDQKWTNSITISPLFYLKISGSRFFIIFNFFLILVHAIIPMLIALHYLYDKKADEGTGNEFTSTDIFTIFIGSHQLLMSFFAMMVLVFYCLVKSLESRLIVSFGTINLVNAVLYLIFVIMLLFYALVDKALESEQEWILFYFLIVTLLIVFSFMIYWSLLLIKVSRKYALNKYNSHQTVIIQSN